MPQSMPPPPPAGEQLQYEPRGQDDDIADRLLTELSDNQDCWTRNPERLRHHTSTLRSMVETICPEVLQTESLRAEGRSSTNRKGESQWKALQDVVELEMPSEVLEFLEDHGTDARRFWEAVQTVTPLLAISRVSERERSPAFILNAMVLSSMQYNQRDKMSQLQANFLSLVMYRMAVMMYPHVAHRQHMDAIPKDALQDLGALLSLDDNNSARASMLDALSMGHRLHLLSEELGGPAVLLILNDKLSKHFLRRQAPIRKSRAGGNHEGFQAALDHIRNLGIAEKLSPEISAFGEAILSHLLDLFEESLQRSGDTRSNGAIVNVTPSRTAALRTSIAAGHSWARLW